MRTITVVLSDAEWERINKKHPQALTVDGLAMQSIRGALGLTDRPIGFLKWREEVDR